MDTPIVQPESPYSDTMAQPCEDARCERTEWDAHNHWQWLAGAWEMHVEHACTITVGEGTTFALAPDSVTIRAGSAVLTIGPDTVTSNVDMVAAGTSLMRHKHVLVKAGNDTSGPPA